MRKPSPRELNIQGMHSLLTRPPSDGVANVSGSSGLAGSPAVAEEAPVRSARAEDASTSRYRVRTSSKPADVYINYMVLGEFCLAAAQAQHMALPCSSLLRVLLLIASVDMVGMVETSSYCITLPALAEMHLLNNPQSWSDQEPCTE